MTKTFFGRCNGSKLANIIPSKASSFSLSPPRFPAKRKKVKTRRRKGRKEGQWSVYLNLRKRDFLRFPRFPFVDFFSASSFSYRKEEEEEEDGREEAATSTKKKVQKRKGRRGWIASLSSSVAGMGNPYLNSGKKK